MGHSCRVTANSNPAILSGGREHFKATYCHGLWDSQSTEALKWCTFVHKLVILQACRASSLLARHAIVAPAGRGLSYIATAYLCSRGTASTTNTSMLLKRWEKPPWRQMEENSRHHSPARMAGRYLVTAVQQHNTTQLMPTANSASLEPSEGKPTPCW